MTAVDYQVPVPREPFELLHGREINVVGAENLVGRFGAVHHAPVLRVAGDRRPAQPFEDADLDLLRLTGQQPIEPGCETGAGFAR